MARLSRPTKDKWLGARITSRLEEQIVSYMEASETSMGELIRQAVTEYMANHPIKEQVKTSIDQLKGA